MFAGSIRQRGAAEHSRYFFRALFVHNYADAGARPPAPCLFFDDIVMIGEGGDLR